ncbi:MAG: T9SS type A sorting domain-containing protein [Bacteroidetes bacterium]|nr:T9SS type A sorting domain-containing protein [Bacteroidota bacterium]
MKQTFALLVLALLVSSGISAQSTFISTNYALNGDTFYLTTAQPSSLNFDTTNAPCNWNYASLTGISQRRLVYRPSNQTGFTPIQWPYIFNSSNVNRTSTDGHTTAIGNFQKTNPNDFYLLNAGALQQKASSFNIVINSSSLAIKNVYATADVIYKFPLNYLNADSSDGSYTTNIPNYYYQNTQMHRVNHVDGWGTVITPYGTFSNALRIISDLTQRDSIIINDTLLPIITTISRELKWMDPSKKYPLLVVKQNKVGNNYVTQSVEYFDNQQYFQPAAHFVWVPYFPVVGDTVQFQNLSTNSISYHWDFGDPASGNQDTSTAINPSHIFNAQGFYRVCLIAYNGPLSDSVCDTVTIQTPTSVNAMQELTFRIFPNPTASLITISSNDAISSVEIFDDQGKCLERRLLNKSTTHFEMDFSSYAKGKYFIRVNTISGSQTQMVIHN